MMLANEDDSLVGVTLAGGFVVGERVASGGLTEAFLATRRGERAIVKVLLRLYASLPELRERMRREAELTALVSGVTPRVLGAGEVNGRPWIALEEVRGERLSERMKAERPSVKEAVAIGDQLLACLAKVHAAGILHNDVKPNQVMIVDGRVKLLDLDMALPMDEASGADVAGTPAYLAPERIEGASPSVVSDLYAVGLVLFEMLAGRKPVLGDPVEIQRARVAGEAPRLSEVLPTVSPALDKVIARALARRPAQRFPSARAMRTALRATPEARTGQAKPAPGGAAKPTRRSSPRAPKPRA